MKASELKPPRHAKRDSGPAVADLRSSLRTFGQLQPIVVRPDGEVIAGERRRQAFAPNQEVEVRVIDADEIEALEMRLSDEFAKTEMSSVERAEALAVLKQLLESRGEKITYARLGELTGTTESTIRHHIRLGSLPAPVKRMVVRGEVGSRAASALAGSKLKPREKMILARKFASGAAPAGESAREVVKFAEQAPEKIRKHLTQEPRTTYWEARQADKRQAGRERRQSTEDLAAVRAATFFRRVQGKLRQWTLSLQGIAVLAPEVPQAQREDVRKWLVALRNACDRFLEGMEEDRPPATMTLKTLDRAEPTFE